MNSLNDELQFALDKLLEGRSHIEILEAGCGSISKVSFGPNSRITGIDISEKQLQRNKMLNTKILGDVQEYAFEKEAYDVIVCRYVLEHLPKPGRALQNFARAIRDNGLIILAIPNVFSLKGLITKYTPLRFHIFVYRKIYGVKNAGQNDVGPFKNYMKIGINPYSLIKFYKNHNLDVVYIKFTDSLDSWVGEKLKERSRLIFYCFKFITNIIKIISINKIGDSEVTIILRKKTRFI